ncbi:GDSL-type esterase/lipase family protein [Flavobacterium sp. 3HN19-14]|uniref:GDSL-type esterase/lipase family protein n=1 Tax=Flavobacterium sp. 3HN19-14 TaxID=3448133 RepID=UPI003EE0ADAF
MARTNGSSDIKFTSNTGWQNHRIVSPIDGSPVGLSGIALYTKSDDFAIELNTKVIGNEFNTIKIITPKNANSFDIATAKRTITLESNVPKKITHKIKSGQTISEIADKYNVSIAEIKKANRLKSNLIRAGKTLKIPTDEMQKKAIQRSEFIPLSMEADINSHFYKTDISLNKIYLLPNKSENSFALNGVVLENKNSGVIYHNIGVNGAKLSDYNKYPMFFEQLKALEPDLVVIALGTNESFDKMTAAAYMEQLAAFIQKVKEENGNINILVITPPPSNFKRKYPNIFAADYAKKIIDGAEDGNYTVWDMYSQMGGLFSVNRNFRNGLMANDRVHYSKSGYEKQGDLFSEAILKAFQDYKNSRN